MAEAEMRGKLRALVIAGVLSGAGLAAVPGVASAGQWVQISCVNGNGTGSLSSSQGWTSASGGTSAPDSASSTCGPGTPMSALLPTAVPGPLSAAETLTYTPPGGSTLAGGTMSVQLSGDGSGSSPAPNNSSGAAIVMSPVDSVNDEVETCAAWSAGCWAGEGNGPGGPADFNGVITLPSNQGGTVTVFVACLSQGSATPCNTGGNDGVWAGAWVPWADLLLSSSNPVSGGNFAGAALQPNASGTAPLTFTASEPSGPGIYNVNVSVDGNSVYSATPDTNNGQCVSQGTYPGTSALEFDYAQPCPLSDSLSVPINTATLADGKHALVVTATDAAGNTSAIYTGSITTDNATTAAVSAPVPAAIPPKTASKKAVKALPKVRVKFVIQARYQGAVTRFLKFSSSKFNKRATLSVTDSGPRHPKLKLKREPAKRAGMLLRELTKLRFRAGDRLILTVVVPNKRRERLELTFRKGKVPKATLL
jgi:hypothetical protein